MGDAKQRSRESQANKRLGSWKEIAAYFDRTVRTVQRWEATEDLPVHRHQHKRGDSVFADTNELDTWAEKRHRARPCPAGTPSTAKPVKIAILPFQTSGGDDCAYLGAGIAESLISRFNRIERLQVASAESVLRLDFEGLGASETARRLGVNYVVDGSIGRVADQVRVRVRLLRLPDSVYVWSDQYEARVGDIPAMEQRIAESVARETCFALGPALPGTAIPEAFQNFLKGRHATRQFSYFRQEVYSLEAQRFLARALELDPAYAEALAEVGYLEYLRWEVSGDGRRLDGSAVALRRSLELDAANPDAHYTAGRNAIMALDSNSALEHAKLALRYAPHACRSNLLLGGALWAKGLWEDAERASRRAITADPLNLCSYTDNANVLGLLGRNREAIARAEEALHVEPGAVAALSTLAGAHILRGDLENAARVFRSALEKSPAGEQHIFDIGLAFLSAAAGDIEQARRVRGRYSGNPAAVSLFGVHFYVFLCSLCGEVDEAAQLIAGHPYLGNYRSLISLWPLWPLRSSHLFRRLLEERYEDWRHDIAALGPQLWRRPPSLTDPNRF
jgi:TolB-like protein/Flp pilus assembly protein TadD